METPLPGKPCSAATEIREALSHYEILGDPFQPCHSPEEPLLTPCSCSPEQAQDKDGSQVLSAQHSHVPATPPGRAVAHILENRQEFSRSPFPSLPSALLPGASHANLDEGVDFDPPALGERFDLHLANGAHVQMVHSRATPKPAHRERRAMENCTRVETSQPCILQPGIFILLQTLPGEGGA